MESIEEKLKKLEAMMNDKGSSDGEKANAFKLFERLVEKYNIDLSNRKVEDVDFIEHKSNIAFAIDSFRPNYSHIIWLYSMYFNVVTIQRKKDGLIYYTYVGKETDIIMLDYMYTATIRQFQQMFRFKLFSKNADGILSEFLIEMRKIIVAKMAERNDYFNNGLKGQEIILVRKNDIQVYTDYFNKKYGQTKSASRADLDTSGAKGVGANVAKGINFNRPLNQGKSNLQLN